MPVNFLYVYVGLSTNNMDIGGQYHIGLNIA